jgi:hypothetical protein
MVLKKSPLKNAPHKKRGEGKMENGEGKGRRKEEKERVADRQPASGCSGTGFGLCPLRSRYVLPTFFLGDGTGNRKKNSPLPASGATSPRFGLLL